MTDLHGGQVHVPRPDVVTQRLGVRVLGRLRVDHGSGSPIDLGGPRPRTVLALLLVEAGRVVSTDHLVDQTWGGAPPASARRTLQAYVAGLRRALGGDQGPLRSETGGYVLDADALDVDARRFEAMVADGREAVGERRWEPALTTLTQALSLWEGEPFTDLPVDEVPALAIERTRLGELRLLAVEARMDAARHVGRHREIIPELESLVAEHPERGALWAHLVGALHAAGRTAEALRAAQRHRQFMATELGLDPSEEVRQLEERIAVGERVDGTASAVCPYKGLAQFSSEDASLFFGRGQLVDRVVVRLAERRLVAVVGASGTGKSSLVRAGLVPALEAGALPGGAWQVTVTAPGERPTTALGAAPDPSTGRHLVVIDQFEEVFTLCDDAGQRHRFFSRLVELVEQSADVFVVIVVRADYFGGLAVHADLGALVSAGTVLVGPMTPAELEGAVTGPARHAGLTVEPELVEALLQDTVSESGALPLLSHALVETWTRRRGDILTLAGYLQSGGVAGAVAQTAESTLHNRLTAEQRAIARDVLLRLVQPGRDGAADTRRTVTARELAGGHGGEVRAVVDVLASARLVTLDDRGIRLAHESLIRAWPSLARWLEEERQGLLLRLHLTEAAKRWERDGRDPADLLRGARLAAVVEWLEQTGLSLTPQETAFVDAGAAAADRERRQAEERAHRQARANRRLRLLVGIVLVAFVSAAVVGVIALRQRARAQANAETAIAGRLAAEVDRLVGSELDLALLLAAEAVAYADRPETRRALFDAVGAQPRVRRLVRHGGDEWLSPMLSADGSTLVTGVDGGGSVLILSVADGDSVRAAIDLEPPLTPSIAPPTAVAADGSLVAVQQPDGTVWLVDGRTGQPIDEVLRTEPEAVLAFDPGTTTLAIASPTTRREPITPREDDIIVALVDPATGRTTGPEFRLPGGMPTDLAFSPDGSRLAVVSIDDHVSIHDRATGDSLADFHGPYLISDVTFDGDGERVAVVGEGRTRVFEADSGRPLTGPLPHPAFGLSAAFAPGGRLITGTSHGWRVWDLSGERQQGPAVTHAGEVRALTVADDGTVTTADREGRLVRWHVEPLAPTGRRLPLPSTAVFSPDATDVVTVDPAEPTTPFRYDIEREKTVWQVPPQTLSSPITRLAWSADGRRVAAAARAGQIIVLSATDGSVEGEPIDLTAGDGVRALDWSPGGAQYLAVAVGRDVRVLDVADGTAAETATMPSDVTALKYLTDDRILVGDAEGAVHAFDAATGAFSPLFVLAGAVPVEVLEVEGPSSVIVGGADGELQFRSAPDWDAMISIDAGAGVQGVTVSPDGRWLAASLATGQTRVFDVSTGQPAGAVGQSGSTVWVPHPVAFDAAGEHLYAWDNESYVAWTYDIEQWQAAACEMAGRVLTSQERMRFLVDPTLEPACPD